MKRLQILIAFLLFATFAAASEPANVPPVLATLTLPYSTVLPGVPFDMTVTLKNASGKTVSAGAMARLSIKLPDGASYESGSTTPLEPCDPSEPDSTIELAPGASVDRVITWLPYQHTWTSDGRYTGPGVYQVTLELVAGRRDVPSSYIGPLRTNSVRLERAVAPGEDAEIWQKMLSVSNGVWSDNGFARLKAGLELAKEITETHVTSGYYPYALLLTSTTQGKDAIAPLLDAAERFQSSPAHPYLLKQAADCAFREANQAAWFRDDEKSAREYYTRAGELFQRAIKTSSLAVRAGSERGQHDAANAQQKLRPRQKE